MKKYVDPTWDFRNTNTKTFTHCYHAYPAMMIPQIAERLLAKYGSGAALLFDPYCGTGTSLVEANLKGIDAVGTDLNPLARLIARTKTAKINLQILDLYLKEFNDFAFSVAFGIQSNLAVSIPEIKNMDFWFEKSVQQKLGTVKKFIENIAEPDVANFFKIAFSETVREASWTRNGEFKLFRMTEDQMRKFNPDVFGMLQNKLARNRKGLIDFLQKQTSEAKSSVFSFNSSQKVEHLAAESVDIVLTSPPYGDSRTTVAYGQFSRLANEWLGAENSNQVDSNLMGGKKLMQNAHFESAALMESLGKIQKIDSKRAGEVASFYVDYEHSIKNVSKTVRPGGFACYVVGNRKVKSTILPTDEITKDFFEKEGFRHIETIIRSIPNKRMPAKNSPTNETGLKDDTMCHEWVVVMQKN